MVAIRTQDFIKKVLPLGGTKYFYAIISNTSGKFKQSSVDDEYALVAALNKCAAAGVNTFYGTATHSTGERTKHTVEGKKCYYADIDAGEGKPYADVRAVLAAVKAWLQRPEAVKPSLIVQSGAGLHLYWVLNEVITRDAWTPVAAALRAALVGGGLHIDESITTDEVRILRVPGTVNTKTGRAPSTCQLLLDTGVEYSNAELAAALRTLPPAFDDADEVDNSDLTSGLKTEYGPKYAEPIFAKCGVMRHTRDTMGKDQPGKAWHKVLHLLAFTEDGEDFIHAVSKGHDEYTPEVTTKRFAYSVNQRTHKLSGPTGCEKFAEHFPAICAACPHRGRITTPIVLGDPTKLDLPLNYFQTPTGVFFQPQSRSDDDEAPKAKFIMPYNFLDFRVASDFAHGTYVFHTTNVPRVPHEQRSVTYEASALTTDSAAVANAITKAGMTLNTEQMKLYRNLTVAWVQALQAAGETQHVIKHFGWLENRGRAGFAVGTQVFWSDGRGDQTMRTDDHIAQQYIPLGNMAPWQAACNFVLAQGRPELAAIIASSFAAPLIRFTGVSGALLSIVSRESGTGKSTALQIAQGVWGSPQEGIHALNDTTNSVVRKLGTLKNLPAYWDELRMKEEVKNFVRLVFQLTQGKEKSRLTAQSSMHSMGTWDTLIAVASNEPVLDHVAQLVHGTDAGQARVFELTCAQQTSTNGAGVSAAMAMFGKLKNNYGHAGLVYAKFLAENAPMVRTMVEQTRDRLSAVLGVTTVDRFRLAVVTALVVGAQLATKLGLAQFDVPAMTKYLVAQFKAMRIHTQAEFEGDGAMVRIQQFINQHADNKVVSKGNSLMGSPGRASNTIVELPKRAPVMTRVHISPHDVSVAVNAALFFSWAYGEYGLMRTNLTDELLALGAQIKQISLGAGTPYAMGQTKCIVISAASQAGLALGLDDFNTTDNSDITAGG